MAMHSLTLGLKSKDRDSQKVVKDGGRAEDWS